MLQTSLLLMKSLNKTETPIFKCVFFASKDNLFDVYLKHYNSEQKLSISFIISSIRF